VSSQIRGFYLVKFAVSVTACYLTIQLLITFAEVLLPFIFAVLIVIVLEPLKKFVMRVFSKLMVRTLLALRLDFCIENMPTNMGADTRLPSLDEYTPYGSLPEDSTTEDAVALPRPAAIPIPAVKRFLVALSIAFCLVMSGRVLWLTAKVFFRAGSVISGNMDSYRKGAERLKGWVQTYIHDLHLTSLDYGKLLDELVAEVEHIGSVVTQSVIYTAVQAVVTFIFLIYMLWSPVKMDGSAVAAEVFTSTSRYLKVKCLTSAFTGLSVGILLWAIGLDLPAAFGLLSFLANFLPGIGSPAASVLPCILAIIDVRKTPTQVLLAFVLQAIMHFFIDFVIEPVFFGISVEIHSVIVILGIWFFYQVWGVPGMLLSVPLLSVVRIMMKSMKHAGPSGGGEDADTVAFLDGVFAGRWMSSVGETGEEELDFMDQQVVGQKSGEQEQEPVDQPPVCGDFAQHDLWTVLQQSQLGQELRQFYLQHQLLFDLSALISMTSVVILVQ